VEATITLRPGKPGTKRLQAEYGDRLIYVRYRYDLANRRRIKTVELIVHEAPWDRAKPALATDPQVPSPVPPADEAERLVGVAVDARDVSTRQRIKRVGGRWNPDKRLWLLPLRRARALGLGGRVIRL